MLLEKNCRLNVHDAAIERVRYIFNEFENIYVSFSGGKDSGVCMHLMCEEARRLNRKIGVLFIDIEAHYQMTIDYAMDMMNIVTLLFLIGFACLWKQTIAYLMMK